MGDGFGVIDAEEDEYYGVGEELVVDVVEEEDED